MPFEAPVTTAVRTVPVTKYCKAFDLELARFERGQISTEFDVSMYHNIGRNAARATSGRFHFGESNGRACVSLDSLRRFTPKFPVLLASLATE